MAKQSSPKASSLAGRVLRDPDSSETERQLAGSVLSNDETPGQGEKKTPTAKTASIAARKNPDQSEEHHMAKAETGRTAVILKETNEVIDIKLMEGAEPDLRNPENYLVEEVPGDVQIGMIRKGAGKFEWPEGEDGSGRYGPGTTRYKDLADKADAANADTSRSSETKGAKAKEKA